jgi:hypothetical protein
VKICDCCKEKPAVIRVLVEAYSANGRESGVGLQKSGAVMIPFCEDCAKTLGPDPGRARAKNAVLTQVKILAARIPVQKRGARIPQPKLPFARRSVA